MSGRVAGGAGASIVLNEVRHGSYLDSVALMRISREIAALPDIEEAGLMMGTPANLRILDEAGLLAREGRAAAPGDLVIAVRARDRAAADAAIARARAQLDRPRTAAGAAQQWRPRTLRAAVRTMPEANLALISVPGDFAAAEARKALGRGLNVMIFSDNVPLAEEAALKEEARARGLLVMGPDCGTAIIAGTPLAFANAVPRGPIGIVGASGTGIQEVSTLIARAGHGISHAIGTGGRDLKAEVGAITTLMAIDLLDADPATEHVVLISKPPAADVARRVLARIGRSGKPFTVCFLGGRDEAMPANARVASLLEDTARLSMGQKPERASGWRSPMGRRAGRVQGLFAGGSLCAEAQVVFRDAGQAVTSNAPIPGFVPLDRGRAHAFIDLGEDAYTRGRPHPMIEPAVRDAPLAAALADPSIAVVLLDVVLGYGAHADPAGHLARALAGSDLRAYVVASVTGTDADPQRLTAQVRILEAAGVLVAPSNAAAARLALDLIDTSDGRARPTA